MQPNPNPNNKAALGIDATITFQTYLITPIGLNGVQIRSGKVIRPEHTPIITKEECESPRKDIVDSETAVTHVTANTTPIITPVAASSGRSNFSTSANPSKDGPSVTADSTVEVQDPPYPQQLIEIGLASQTEFEFLKGLRWEKIEGPCYYPCYGETV